jgi:hypothetical protein
MKLHIVNATFVRMLQHYNKAIKMECVFARCDINIYAMKPFIIITTWFENDESPSFLSRVVKVHNGLRLEHHPNVFFHFISLDLNTFQLSL